MLLFKKGQALPGFFFGYRQQHLFFFFWLFFFPHRDHGLQRLDHGSSVIIPHPCCQSDQPGLYANAVCGNRMNAFDTFWLDLRLFRCSYDIPFDQPVSPAKRDFHHHYWQKFPPHIFRDPVLKRFIQFFVGNVHDNIGIWICHCNFSSFRIS